MQLPKKLDITYIQRHYTQKPQDFSSLLKPLCTVTHLDELVYIFHHLPLFTETTLITDINIFKSPIKPLWEDKWNIAGGKYIIKLKKCVGQRLFERLVISFAILDDHINGIVASIRSSQVILSVWCDTTQNNLDFVKRVRKMLDVNYEIPIEYKHNDESLKDNSSFRNTAVFGKVEIGDEGLEGKVDSLNISKDTNEKKPDDIGKDTGEKKVESTDSKVKDTIEKKTDIPESNETGGKKKEEGTGKVKNILVKKKKEEVVENTKITRCFKNDSTAVNKDTSNAKTVETGRESTGPVMTKAKKTTGAKMNKNKPVKQSSDDKKEVEVELVENGIKWMPPTVFTKKDKVGSVHRQRSNKNG